MRVELEVMQVHGEVSKELLSIMLWKRDWSFEGLSSHQRVDMACCIIGVGLDSAVLCAVEPITDYCCRYFIELQFFLESSGEQCQHDSKSVKDP